MFGFASVPNFKVNSAFGTFDLCVRNQFDYMVTQISSRGHFRWEILITKQEVKKLHLFEAPNRKWQNRQKNKNKNTSSRL